MFLGDLIDQGKESREVLERIIELKRECHVVLIQGNHEEMMYAAWESEAGTAVLGELRRRGDAQIRLYERYGFQHIGVRRGYYPAHNGREDAVVMRITL